MSARQSKAVHDALQAVKSGARPVDAARVHGCHVQSLYRALRALKPQANQWQVFLQTRAEIEGRD